MNNMLKDTNKNIKNMEINKTESIIIDYNWICILSVLSLIVFILGVIAFPIAATATLLYLILGGLVVGIGAFTGIVLTIYACFG